MILEKETIKILENALTQLEKGFTQLPDINIKYDIKKIEKVTNITFFNKVV